MPMPMPCKFRGRHNPQTTTRTTRGTKSEKLTIKPTLRQKKCMSKNIRARDPTNGVAKEHGEETSDEILQAPFAKISVGDSVLDHLDICLRKLL